MFAQNIPQIWRVTVGDGSNGRSDIAKPVLASTVDQAWTVARQNLKPGQWVLGVVSLGPAGQRSS